jgi:hypothetical protein
MRVVLSDSSPFKLCSALRQLLSVLHRGGAVRYFVRGSGALVHLFITWPITDRKINKVGANGLLERHSYNDIMRR